MIAHLVVALVAAAVAFVATPLARRIAVRVGAIDVPDDRKVHRDPTATLGGLAIWAAMLAAIATAWLFSDFSDLLRTSTEPLGVVIAGTAVVLVGAVDDVRGMRASTKLAGQIVAAGALVLAGIQLFYFWLPGIGLLSLSSDLSALLTVLWTIALINAVNLIDGLDGLAAGVAAIAGVSFFAYAYESSNGAATTATLLSAIVVGACVGFLPHNFNPARIFMGDAGSMLLGVMLSAATVSGVGRTTEPQFADVAGLIVPVLLPLFVLAVPLADAGFAIMRRVRGGRPVFHPDKQHIHHWLLDMASSHRQAVVVMYLWSGMLAAAALVLALGVGLAARAAASVLGAALVVSIVVVPRMLRRQRGILARERIHKQPKSLSET